MGWATRYIEDLQRGATVIFRPRGGSMTGLIESGDRVTVVPIGRPIVKGDIVLCRVRGTDYLHLVTAVDGERYQISNNRGRVNGWTRQVFGVVSCIESEP